MSISKNSKLLSIVLTIPLISCGGGSGGGSTNDPDPEPDRATSEANKFADNFVDSDWESRYDFDIFHRDDVLVAETSWQGDHSITGPDDLCGSPDETRTINRGERNSDFNNDWIYRCVPNGDETKAHLMTSIGDTSGYSIGAFSPKQTFHNISEVRWHLNTTDLKSRQFTEVKIIPAEQLDFQNLPCVPDLPCKQETEYQPNYDDLNAVGTATSSGEGTGLLIATPDHPDGITQDLYDRGLCPMVVAVYGFCFKDYVHEARIDKLQRFLHIFRDNGDGTLTFAIEKVDGSMRELTVPGSFPSGDVRVIFADHNYTPDKDGDPIGHTWHWDNISIE